MLKEIIIASANSAKVREFSALLSPVVGRIVPMGEMDPVPELEEKGASFRENALGKARTVLGASGLPTLADDSGLEVQALHGRPGVYSARYAGSEATDDDNIRKLLDELEGVENRAARFVCCLALVYPDGREIVVEGVCEGVIAEEPKGEGGFGYDPVFMIPELGKTMAQISPGDKNSISHRGRASRAMIMYLNGHKTRA
ncbi:MAG: XTP/dITP diphosphatase [Candidatus Dadabacteria bacterium]|nr:XTP/dITP diphosphatase [Candidatus Dadabacteria bacterium]